MLETKDYTTLSGKQLNIAISTFENGAKLGLQVLQCLKKIGINIKADLANFDLSAILKSPDIVQIVTNATLEVFTDATVDKIFWEMARKCTYDGLRVTPDLFNNSLEARGDYYQIKFLILKENIAPFFPSLHTTLQEQQAK